MDASRPSNPAMRPIRWLLPMALLVLALPALAQTDPVIAETRARLAARLEAAVRSKLPLGQNQAAAFWPLYAEYRADAASTGDRAAELLEDFIVAYPTLDDETAAVLLTDWLTVQQQQLDLRHRWVDRFLDDLPARTVMRFFQIENQFDTALRAQLAQGIPLAKVEVPNNFLDPLRNPLDAPPPQ